MNILLSTFFHKDTGFSMFYYHFYEYLIKYLPEDKIDIKFVMTEDYYREYKDSTKYKINNAEAKVIESEHLTKIFNQNYSTIEFSNKLIKEGLSQEEKNEFKKLIKDKLGSWEPDIAITQGHCPSLKIWGDVFPNALCLNRENGIFARAPFLRSITYDPFGTVPYSYMTKFSDEIKNLKISKKENNDIKTFKKKLTKLIDKTSSIDKEISKYKKQFKKLVLLSLTGDIRIKLFCDTKYKSEIELVEDVMRNAAEDIGVFVTKHDVLDSLTDYDIDYFSKKYKNFIFLKSTDKRNDSSNSLHYYKHIDAIINITSKAGLLALFWDVPVLSIANTTNDLIKDGQGIEELENVLKMKSKDKNNILYWYFTHYLTLWHNFTTKDYMYDYFEEKIKYFRQNGIDFNYYNKINDIEEISQKTIEHLERQYPEIKLSFKIKNKLNQISEQTKALKEKIKLNITTFKQKLKKYYTIFLISKS